MDLLLQRIEKTDKTTVGKLFIDGKFECYTLEDVEREVKIKSETAIPKGHYDVIITLSNRFKRDLPLLLNVPNFEGIRIHSGNSNHDTEGCILVGSTKIKDFVGNSRNTFNKLFEKLKKANNINIKIV